MIMSRVPPPLLVTYPSNHLEKKAQIDNLSFNFILERFQDPFAMILED